MRFIKKIILSFCMVSVLLGSMPLCVYANDLNDGENDGYDRFMGGHNIDGFNTWEATDKKSFTLANIGSFFASIGMYFKGMSNENLMDILIAHLIESGRIEDAESTDEYIASHLTANEEETELYLSSDFTNALYETSVQYIEEETGYFVIPTLSAKDLVASDFANKPTFDIYKDYINNLGSDICIVSGGISGSVTSGLSYSFYDGTTSQVAYKNCYSFLPLSDDFSIICNNINTSNTYPYLSGASVYTSDWIYYHPNNLNVKVDFLTVRENEPITNNKYYYDELVEGDTFMSSGNVNSVVVLNYVYFTSYNIQQAIFTSDGRSIRVYKTLADFKNYSVGTRPYYITDAFKNYDSTIDNSTTITQTEIDNSVTYGDVYNYITNNYENPDGLTEDELRAILEEYLSQIGGGSGSGSGGGSGGSDDGGSSGGGLGSFLEGLGSIGDAILSILGKLLEYIGKALELLTGTVTKVLDLIPSNVTNLLLGLFPFIPQEWVTAIELSLVLGVVLAVVGAFKK